MKGVPISTNSKRSIYQIGFNFMKGVPIITNSKRSIYQTFN